MDKKRRETSENTTLRLKNESFFKKMIELLYDGSLDKMSKKDIIDYLSGYFSGLTVMQPERIEELRKEVKKSFEIKNDINIKENIDISDVINRFFDDNAVDIVYYNDNHNGISLNIYYIDSYHKQKLVYINRNKNINLTLIKNI